MGSVNHRPSRPSERALCPVVFNRTLPRPSLCFPCRGNRWIRIHGLRCVFRLHAASTPAKATSFWGGRGGPNAERWEARNPDLVEARGSGAWVVLVPGRVRSIRPVPPIPPGSSYHCPAANSLPLPVRSCALRRGEGSWGGSALPNVRPGPSYVPLRSIQRAGQPPPDIPPSGCRSLYAVLLVACPPPFPAGSGRRYRPGTPFPTGEKESPWIPPPSVPWKTGAPAAGVVVRSTSIKLNVYPFVGLVLSALREPRPLPLTVPPCILSPTAFFLSSPSWRPIPRSSEHFRCFRSLLPFPV